MRPFLKAALIAVLALALPAVASAQSPVTRYANLLTAVGATGASTVLLDTSQAAIATIQTSGTFVGTITYQASVDGTNWVSLFCQPLAATNPITGVTAVATATTAVIARCNVAGILAVRANVTAYTSGSITVVGSATSLGSGAGNALQN